jgi:4-amino-4-deoxy-L-arabinose transferase-like glycosyltransferase
MKPADPAAWFWPTAAIYLTVPMFLWTGSISFHDHLLTFFCLLSGHLFLVFAEKWEADRRGFAWLYAAAAALGLATLTKYNGALLGIGIAVFFALRPQLRPLWRSPHLYLAALLSVVMQAPVFWWNFTEGLASYRFHLSERWGSDMLALKPWLALSFVGVTIALTGPFLFPAIIGFIRRPFGEPFADRARQLGLAALVVSTLVMGALSFFITIFFYWNIVAYIMMMPLIAGWMKWRWLANAHYTFGIVAALVYGLHVIAYPLSDWTIQSTFGWDEIGARITALEQSYKVDFIATTRYTTAAQLGFAMHDPEVVAISPRHDQYDYWFDPAAHEGQDAIIVTDDYLGLGGVTPSFETLTPLAIMDITRLGQPAYRVGLYLGHNFRPAPAQ